MADSPARPKRYAPWFNLNLANMPVPAWVSIFNRASGAGMFLLLFFVLYLLDRSLASPEGYASVKGLVSNWFVKLVLLGLLWAFLHHACAGVRYLLLDLDQGVDLAPARASAKAVFAVSLTLTVILAAVLLW